MPDMKRPKLVLWMLLAVLMFAIPAWARSAPAPACSSQNQRPTDESKHFYHKAGVVSWTGDYTYDPQTKAIQRFEGEVVFGPGSEADADLDYSPGDGSGLELRAPLVFAAVDADAVLMADGSGNVFRITRQLAPAAQEAALKAGAASATSSPSGWAPAGNGDQHLVAKSWRFKFDTTDDPASIEMDSQWALQHPHEAQGAVQNIAAVGPEQAVLLLHASVRGINLVDGRQLWIKDFDTVCRQPPQATVQGLGRDLILGDPAISGLSNTLVRCGEDIVVRVYDQLYFLNARTGAADRSIAFSESPMQIVQGAEPNTIVVCDGELPPITGCYIINPWAKRVEVHGLATLDDLVKQLPQINPDDQLDVMRWWCQTLELSRS